MEINIWNSDRYEIEADWKDKISIKASKDGIEAIIEYKFSA